MFLVVVFFFFFLWLKMVEFRISTLFSNVWTGRSCQRPEPARSQVGEGSCLAALCVQSLPEPPPPPTPVCAATGPDSEKSTESCSLLFAPSSAVNESGWLSRIGGHFGHKSVWKKLF